jgi:hypothetical protein
MQKRGYMVWSQIATGILVLIILGLGIKIVIDLTGNPVRYLLGTGNISKLDQDITERYESTASLNKDAIASTNGLIYAINSLAVFDTNREKEPVNIIDKVKQGFTQKEDLGAYKKDFGAVKVEATYFDRRTLYLGGDKESVLFDLTKATLDCWGIFGDKANANTRCFLVRIKEGTDLGFVDEFPNYLNNFNKCDSICQDSTQQSICIARCKTAVKEINGGNWLSFWNLANYDYDITKEELVKNDYEFRICGSNAGINEIHFSFKDDYCKAPQTDEAFGYIVENFALPQEIDKSSNPLTYTVEEWLSAYGDPQYILFYEKFPKEEAEYWKAGSYNVAFLTILETEAAFIGIDVLTWGMGRAFTGISKVLSPTIIGRGGRAVKNAITSFGRAVGGTIGSVLGWVWRYTGAKGINIILRKQITVEALESSSEGIIRNTLRKTLRTEVYDQLDDDAIVLLKKKYMEALDTLGEEAFDRGGRITKQGMSQLDANFRIVMNSPMDAGDLHTLSNLVDELGGVRQLDNVVVQIGKDLSEEVSQLSLRAIPRAMVRAYKSATRANNMLSIIFLGDMTDTKRTEVLMKAMDDWEAPFRAMKPRELRAFVANQKSATELLDKMIEGELGDTAQKAAARELRDNMDDTLAKVIQERGDLGKLFTTGVTMQKYSAEVTKWEASKLQNPRHLIALMAGYYATKIESMQGKFYSVGTNAIGLKTPYMATVPYDDEYSKSITTFDGEKEFLTNYGEGSNVGFLPVVNRYFLSLTKDELSWWSDQDPQRFHLESPCYADVIMRVGNCDCKGTEDPNAGLYSTGKTYQIYGTDENGNRVYTGETINVPNFNEKPMLYRLDENGNALKECYAGTWYRWDTSYPTKCIKINPVMDQYRDLENNYCYHGKDPSFEAIKGTITSLEIALPLLCAAPGIATFGVGLGPCFAGMGFVTGFIGESTKTIMETQHQWPSHD